MPLQEQRIYCACAPRRSLQLCQLSLLTYSGVPLQKYQHTRNLKPNSLLNWTGRLPSHLDVNHFLYLNPGGSRIDDRPAFSALSFYHISFNAVCLGKRPALHFCPSVNCTDKNREYKIAHCEGNVNPKDPFILGVKFTPHVRWYTNSYFYSHVAVFSRGMKFTLDAERMSANHGTFHTGHEYNALCDRMSKLSQFKVFQVTESLIDWAKPTLFLRSSQ